MNKYQKRRNKIEPYKFLLNKNQFESIIYNDDAYRNFKKLIETGKEIADSLIKKLFKS